MKNGFRIKYQDLEKEGFRLDLSCDCAAMQSLPCMRRHCVTLQVSVLVKKEKGKGKEGKEKGTEVGRKEGRK